MKLTIDQIENLARLVGIMQENEADCDACLQNVAEYAESVIAEKPLTQTMETIEQHLRLCLNVARNIAPFLPPSA